MVEGLISVVMANYNSPKEYLREAIESILNQTYTKFEFIIIDDGSTDDSLSVIESYHDDRIKIIRNEKNLGIMASRNKGIALSKGEFIAFMDTDDVSFPERFEVQIAYMKAHHEVILTGTWIEHIGDWKQRGFSRFVKESIPNREIYRINLLFANRPRIYQSSAMLNHRLAAEHGIRYDEDKLYAEDYKLWVSCAEAADCYIIPQVLTQYRIHSGSIMANYDYEIVKLVCMRISQERLDKLHLTLKPEELSAYRKLQYNRKSYDIKTREWVYRLMNANKIYHVYDQKTLKRILWERWTRISYYGLMNSRSFTKKIQILAALPAFKYPRLIHIISDNRYKRLKRKLITLSSKG